MKKAYSFSISEIIVKELDKICTELKISRNNAVSLAISSFIDKYENVR